MCVLYSRKCRAGERCGAALHRHGASGTDAPHPSSRDRWVGGGMDGRSPDDHVSRERTQSRSSRERTHSSSPCTSPSARVHASQVDTRQESTCKSNQRRAGKHKTLSERRWWIVTYASSECTLKESYAARVATRLTLCASRNGDGLVACVARSMSAPHPLGFTSVLEMLASSSLHNAFRVVLACSRCAYYSHK